MYIHITTCISFKIRIINNLLISSMYIGHPLIPNVVATEVALDSFAVTWGTFSHDACGHVAYSFRLSWGVQLITENTTTGNGIHFIGLNHTTLYEVCVFATNNAGQGPAKTINVTTLTPAGKATVLPISLK